MTDINYMEKVLLSSDLLGKKTKLGESHIQTLENINFISHD